MAIEHIKAHEVVRLQPPEGSAIRSRALHKGEQLELLQIALAAGETRPRHAVHAEMSLYGLLGRITLQLWPAGTEAETEVVVAAGELVLLAAGTAYAMRAEAEAAALATIALPFAGSASQTSPGSP